MDRATLIVDFHAHFLVRPVLEQCLPLPLLKRGNDQTRRRECEGAAVSKRRPGGSVRPRRRTED
jgi:hypothetical protein